MPHAIAWVAAALACGIAFGVWAIPPPSWPALALLAAFLASAICLWRGFPGRLLIFVLSGWVAAGATLGSRAESRARRPALVQFVQMAAPDGQVHLTGRLRDDGAVTASGVALSLDAEVASSAANTPHVRGGIRLTVVGGLARAHAGEWRAGRRVRLTARLREPSRYYDPGVPDHRLALARRGTVLVGSVKSAALVEVTARGSRLEETAAAVRQRVRDHVSASVGRLSPRSAAIVTAVLIGDRAGLGAEVERRLQEAGTYHVIAISGGNIAVFAICLLTLGRVLRLAWRTRLAVAALGLIVYGEIAAGGSSVTRATVVALVYLGATALDQRSGAASALGIAAVLILCATPLAVLDAGFVLTFGATIAILVGVPRAVAASRTRGPAAVVVALTTASFATELALLPIGALFFSRITVAGLVLNLAAVPLMSVVQVGGMVTVALQLPSRDAAALAAWIPHLASEGLVRSAGLVDHAPWLTWRVAAPPWWLIGGYYASLGAWLARRRYLGLAVPHHRLAARLVAACAGGAGLLVVSGPLHAGIDGHPGRLRVSVLDVGQGDSTLIQTPDGRALLVDAGGLGGEARFDVGERVVAPALWALGVKRLETLVLTHGDPDHIGGAAALIEMFAPRELWEGIAVPAHAPLAAVARTAAAHGTLRRSVRSGNVLHVGAVTIHVLHPQVPDWERQRVRNDDSIVLDVRYGNVSVILPGDIGAEIERSLNPVAGRLAPVRILKVAHHGSATSTDASFLAAVRPQIAIVSCGPDNRYGHPVPTVLERLRSIGVTVYRTDQQGAVLLETDGSTVWVGTVRGQ